MELRGAGSWKFDENIVPVFDKHVRQSVPLYDDVHRLVTDISGWFIQDDTNVYDIGTSTGKVISNLINAYPEKKVRYIGIDSSADMCKQAKERFLGIKSVEILHQDVTSDFIFVNSSLITSVLTIQFIAEHKRQMLINRIYSGLHKGGAFIFVEKVLSNSARINEIWTELYHQMKIDNGLSEEHVFEKAKSLRGVLRPWTAGENIEMLRQAGFKEIDMFFKWNNFAGFVAIK